MATNNGTSLTLDFTGTANGNLLIGVVAFKGSTVPSTPGGWTLDTSIVHTSNTICLGVFTKTSDGTETTVAFGNTSGWYAGYPTILDHTEYKISTVECNAGEEETGSTLSGHTPVFNEDTENKYPLIRTAAAFDVWKTNNFSSPDLTQLYEDNGGTGSATIFEMAQAAQVEPSSAWSAGPNFTGDSTSVRYSSGVGRLGTEAFNICGYYQAAAAYSQNCYSYDGLTWNSETSYPVAPSQLSGTGTVRDAITTGPTPLTTTAYSWDGDVWTSETGPQVTHANSVTTIETLYQAMCGRSYDALLVGAYNSVGFVRQNDATSWNGTAWTSEADIPRDGYSISTFGSGHEDAYCILNTTDQINFDDELHYFNGTSWATESGLAPRTTSDDPQICGHQSNSTILAGGSFTNSWSWMWDGLAWARITSLPANKTDGGGAGTGTNGFVWGGRDDSLSYTLTSYEWIADFGRPSAYSAPQNYNYGGASDDIVHITYVVERLNPTTTVSVKFNEAKADDTLVVVLSYHDTGASTGPSGWTLERSATVSGIRVEIWSEEAAGTEGTVTWTIPSSEYNVDKYLFRSHKYAYSELEVPTMNTGTSTTPEAPALTDKQFTSAYIATGVTAEGNVNVTKSSNLVNLDSGKSSALTASVNKYSTAQIQFGVWYASAAMTISRRNCNGFGTVTGAVISGGVLNSYSNFRDQNNEYNGTSWSATASLANSRESHQAVGPSDTDGIAINGKATASTIQTTVEEWNGTAWSSGAATLVDFWYMGAVGGASDCLVYGGFDFGTSSYLTRTDEYNGTSWTGTVANLGTGRQEITSSGTTSSALAIGGDTSGSSSVASVEKYNGTSWAATGSLNSGNTFVGGEAAGASNEALLSIGTQCEAFNDSVWETRKSLGEAGNPSIIGDSYTAIAAGTSSGADGTTDTFEYRLNGPWDYTLSSSASWIAWALRIDRNPNRTVTSFVEVLTLTENAATVAAVSLPPEFISVSPSSFTDAQTGIVATLRYTTDLTNARLWLGRTEQTITGTTKTTITFTCVQGTESGTVELTGTDYIPGGQDTTP